jgi:ATP-binding cassette subfamily B protein
MVRKGGKKKLSRAAERGFHPVWTTIAVFRELAKEGRWLIAGRIANTLIFELWSFVRSWTQAQLVNALIAAASLGVMTDTLWVAVAAAVGAQAMPTILSVAEGYSLTVAMQRWFRHIDLTLLRKQPALDPATHESKEYRDLLQRVLENGPGRMGEYVERMSWIMASVVSVIIGIVVISRYDWRIAVMLAISTIPELIASTRYGKRVWGIWGSKAEVRRKYYDIREHFYKTTSLTEVTIFRNAEHFFNIIRSLYDEFLHEQRKNEWFRFKAKTLTRIITQAAAAYALIFFVGRVIDGSLSVGGLLFVIGAIGTLRDSMSSIFQNMGKQYEDGLFCADYLRIMNLEPMIQRPKKAIPLPATTPDIVFENVTFAYPTAEKPVLKNISLHIPAGQKLALIGVNGAGKTTLVKLLCRFYDPTEGRILINGRDLKTIDLDTWYDQLGVLMQDYARYHFQVKEAIAVGRTGTKPSIEKVKDAAKAAEADAFIDEWERSYGQQLGVSYGEGVEPSVGQWQKLALARMFYRDPNVLILDEPTSSIDAQAEARIFDHIEKLTRERTTIMISHRFSTVRNADAIAVIKGGKLAEYGTHDELMEKGGTYAKLFRLQARGYKE